MSRVGEYSEEAGMRVVTRTRRILLDEPSEYNERVLVIETDTFGRALLIGHRLAFQTVERLDVYDETLGHVTLNEHPNPRRVLIIGGGDGKIAEIALLHGAERVLVLEIDPKVVEASRLLTDVFSDPRVEVAFGDAAELVGTLSERFDAIIGDYSDPYPDEPARSLLGEDFIGELARLLDPEGVIGLQAGSPVFQKRLVRRVYRSLKALFEHVRLFRSPMPVYPGSFRTYALASKKPTNGPYREVRGEYYNTEIHKASFVLPSFIAELQDAREDVRGELA